MREIAAALLLLAAVSASATTIAPGDVAVANGGYCCCITCPPDAAAYLLDNNGQSKAVLPAVGAVAFGPNGHLFAGSRTQIVEYDTTLAPVRTIMPPLAFQTIRLVIAQSGDIYALSDGGALAVFSPSGIVKKTLALPAANGLPTALDLGPDQCTLFYIDNTVQGRRFNVCTEQPLAGLAPGKWLALRATSDGGYVADAGGALSVFDASDHLLRSYSISFTGGSSALAFDTDPGVIWWMSGTLGKFRFSNSARTAAAATAAVGSSIAVNGETRPSADAIVAANIPALTPSVLGALAIAIIALACQRLGR